MNGVWIWRCRIGPSPGASSGVITPVAAATGHAAGGHSATQRGHDRPEVAVTYSAP